MLAEYVTVANPNVAGQKVAVFAIMFFVFFYGLFIDAASFIYSSEIYPTNIRSRGMALSTVTYFTACIVSSDQLKFDSFLTVRSDLRYTWSNGYCQYWLAILPRLHVLDCGLHRRDIFLLSRDQAEILGRACGILWRNGH